MSVTKGHQQLTEQLKILLQSDHLRKPPGMANTPENCTINERTIEDSDATYNKMLTDHIAGHDCHETWKFHESIIHAAIFPPKNSPRLSLLSCTEDWGQF